jgi:hypothetical protein
MMHSPIKENNKNMVITRISHEPGIVYYKVLAISEENNDKRAIAKDYSPIVL